MPNVSFEKTGNVTGRITVEMTKEELGKKLNEELKKQRGKVNMKGFRRGKVPVSTLRKMMGNEVLGQILDTEIREGLFGYIDENDIKLIFSPQPIEEEGTPVITATTLQDLSLKYEVALEPDFSISLPEEAFEYFVLDVADEEVDKAVTAMLKRAGETETLEEGTVEEGDIIEVTFTESGPVEEKITNSTKLFTESLTEEGKILFVGKSIGDTVAVTDLYSLEDNSSEDYVKKYFLELDDTETDISGKSFDVSIDGISRVIPAEMNEDFFAEYDPSGEITTEADLRQDIVKRQSAGFQQQADGIANFKIQRALVEATEMELPLEMMRRINAEESDGNSFEMFERGVRWMLIRNKFASEEDIKLEFEDIRREAEEGLIGMLGGQRPDFLTDEFIDNYVRRALEDEEQRNRLTSNALEKKIMAALRGKVTLQENKLNADDFNEAIRKFNEENQPPAAEEE